MSNFDELLLGDIHLQDLFREYPNHELQEWVVESFLENKTLRNVYEEAREVLLIFCKAKHALGPNGPTSEQECVFRKINGGCLHGEQFDSGLGKIRLFVQSALALNLATSDEAREIWEGQNTLGNCDFMAHRNAPDVREGRTPLKMIEDAVNAKQEETGGRMIEIRNQVADRVRDDIDIPFTEWRSRM